VILKSGVSSRLKNGFGFEVRTEIQNQFDMDKKDNESPPGYY
jgi:hypothetical protein